ncbi:similar to Saccharomyces cerevisiae YFR022W ROG3 Protein that binds the ubiquitin ligase Rsp5p via its 2 PY motifs [Maudiozyma saulgeensis]|uniref:Similar to Saccharomyces cerevisiae YFR022W ROG3 Protein that binds the ubiquitin ligase Rsp5p via its 2 PY motifs n=1 Tax=Maudiozyma saulgeensis TaxID=1789683 RepID=A0A1X7R0R6_9SACH|nr:similar to Saccharomyces cerevisiae YFR022W ROG3 Protein that binds the ubiquitin ligase Rsp5p via its 2 PY motifs [Kazachstania saulgeensis]
MQTNKDPTIDITIQSGNDEVIILKGPPDIAAPVLLSGVITLNTSETVKVKSVSLRLTGRMTYNVPIVPNDEINLKRLTVDRWLYHHKWDDFNIESYFKSLYKNYQSKTPIVDSKNLRSNIISAYNTGKIIRPKSTTSLLSLRTSTTLTNSSNNSGSLPFQRRKSHTLLKGKYEFPFTSVLPGDVNETIDGLPNTNVSYYLEAIIERTKGKSDLYCRKYVRIIRTITPDIPEISETINVSDTWTDRIFYSISVAAKTLAIGSKVPINISIIPLKSGIKLSNIRISLYETAEYYSKGIRSKIDRVVARIKLEHPEKMLMKVMNDNKFQEKWELDIPFRIPASLSRCIQDCQIINEVRVSHKFKFAIDFANQDGHISRLKANIPVSLFISEFVPLKVKRMKSTTDFTCVTRNIGKQRNNDEPKETIFETGHVGLISAHYDNESILPVTALNDLLAPPEYENHVFDRRFCNDIDIDSALLPPPSDIAPDMLPYEPINDNFSPSGILRDIDMDVSDHRRMSDASCQTMPEMQFNSLDTTIEDTQLNIQQNDVISNLGNYTLSSSTTNHSHSNSQITNIPSNEIILDPSETRDPPPPSYMEDYYGISTSSMNNNPQQQQPRRFRSTSLTNPFPMMESTPIIIPAPAHTHLSSQDIVRSAPQGLRNRSSSTSSNNPFLSDIVITGAFDAAITETIQRFSPMGDSSGATNSSRDIFNLPTTNQLFQTFSEPFEKLNTPQQRRYSVTGNVSIGNGNLIQRDG